ncbi:MAG: hypothetical protein N3B68_02945 [Anaerolineae bacterium]|nr:hypothetical protein [Anaerolineae bacterium]
METKRRLYWFGMTLVLLVAAALRLAALPSLPIGLHYDEAANNILTREIAFGGYRPVFIGAYTGKEVLFFYLGALWFRLVGPEPWVLRLNGAVIGLLAVASVGAAARALWGPGPQGRRVALFAAAGMAVLLPHVILSRYGFRAVSQSLMEALTVALLWRALRTGRPLLTVATGVSLGLSAYTYLAVRLFPIPLALAMLWLLVRAGPARGRYLLQLTVVLLAAAAVFAPLGLYFLRHPEAFAVRISQVAAPTAQEVLEGFWNCVRGLGWPGAGDRGVRFNVAPHPVLEPPVALLALAGLVVLVARRRLTPRQKPSESAGSAGTDSRPEARTGQLLSAPDALTSAARVLLLTALPILLLPSALATQDDVPNHMRLVGVYPFLVILPAIALAEIVRRLPARLQTWGTALALALLLGGNGAATADHYFRWARSPALFDANDGDMVLLARTLDELDTEGATVYVASYHYQHPTVAALSRRYGEVKWLTGGATLVLPPEGGAVYLVPVTAQAPFPWPEELTSRWSVEEVRDPFGRPALWVYRLSADAVAALRPKESPAADFAHVVWVHRATPLASACAAGGRCGVLVMWEIRAPYPALQPVVRLLHPQTGEWARVHPFHYPTAQWTVGEVVLDQQVFVAPPTAPPVDNYEVAVSFFNPQTLEILPRVGPNEEFAGLEIRFPFGALRPPESPTAVALPESCRPAPENVPIEEVRLLGWSALPATLRPGERLALTLCWEALRAPLPDRKVRLWLEGSMQVLLYEDAPVYGRLPFPSWKAGMVVEDRLALRIPRRTPPGTYEVRLGVGAAEAVSLGTLEIPPMERTFAAPSLPNPLKVDFGDAVRLLGYEVGEARSGEPLLLVLYWQARREMEEDYTVFVHLIDLQSGIILAQVDEMPQRGAYPTSLWMTGEVVRDEHTLAVPSLPAGTYALRVGLYLTETGQRLPAGEKDFVLLPLVVR